MKANKIWRNRQQDKPGSQGRWSSFQD